MNLALHGFLLQVFLSILNFKHGFRLCSAGEPGYLDFDNLPETNFSCQGKVIGGYYADVEAGCQMFHVCTIGQKDEIMDIKFLCLNGTVFDQETRVCERVDEVDCSKSERFYNLNLELYGNNAVTLSLHEGEDDDDSTEPRDEQQQQQHHMTSARPSTTSTTSTTTSRPSQPPTTSASFQQHPTGYPQHYQPRPAFSNPSSQSNTHYDDKNSGYHHQYIYHNDERSNNNQATSYQLFSNQGVSSTTPTPQVHQQVRYSSTANPQIVHNEPSTATPHQYHVQSTSSTIQTLLSSNANSQSIINPLYHNHGIASTTEQFNIHNNSPRDIDEYNDSSEEENEEREERRPLEPVQSTNKGKVSQLSIAPVPQQEKHSSAIQMKNSQNSQQQRISINYLPTPNPIQTTIRAFYPTQRSTSQKPQKQQNNQVTQHIHISPPPSIPQLKSHQITINLPPPNIQRIVQNPSPLLPSQSRVIVTAKASVSDESGRPLNASQLITLPIPTIPTAYDDYREGDESFDPFYRDVPRIRNDRRIIIRKIETSGIMLRKKRSATYETDDDEVSSEEIIFNAEIKDIKDLKANLPIIKAILFGLPIPENEEHPPDSENIEYTDINESNEEQSKSLKVPEHISLSTSQSEKDNAKLLVVTKPEEEETETRTIDRQQSERKILHTKNQRQIISNLGTAKQGYGNAESKDTVHSFLQSFEGNNSVPAKANSSIQFGFLHPLNETRNVDSKTGKTKQELLQTRSSSSSNKSSRRKNHSRDSSEESEEYLPRRNTRISRPVSYRHYDEYDVSESIGIRSKHKTTRSRPKDRRIVNYRNDDYIDEDIDDKVYDEENAYRNRKGVSRRGSQGRRVPYRNRNRHFDYEDGIEVDEKPGVRVKTPNDTSKSKVRTHPARYSEDRRRRPESELKKNRRRRPPTSVKDVFTQNNTEIIDTPISEEIDSKSTKDFDPHATVQEERKVSRYSLKNHEHKPHPVSGKKRSNSLERDEESVEDLNEDREDYLDQSEPYIDDYNDSEERDFVDEYIDYADLRPRGGRTKIGSRRNRNRFEDDYVTPPRKNSHRREKSRKLVDKTVDQNNEEITTEIGDIASTTILDDLELRTTSLTTEYPVSDETLAPPDLGNDETPSKTTSPVINKENTDKTELTKITKENTSTEGVLKFTDELPESELGDDAPDDGREVDDVELNEEDYVDDNYEPDSYITPRVEDTTTPSLQPEEKTNHPTVVINDQQQETKVMKDDRIKKTGNRKTENREEYDEIYEDKLESTTIPSSSEEYDDLATIRPTIFTSSASTPKLLAPTTASTRSTFTSTTSTTSSTTTTTTTTTSTTTPAPSSSTPTITTTTTTSTTASTPSSAIRMKSTAKFVKPIALRKNYVYSPPATSPNSVVIRRGQPLSGPKPTKPPPSYNELAPKPVIRRLPLLSRTTTTTSESSILEDEIAAELSRHLAEEARKHSGIPSTSLETITYSTPYSSTQRNNEIPVENSDSNESSDQKLSKEQGFDNEVPKQIQESHNVTQKPEDTMTETPKSDIGSTTLSQRLSDLETTSKKLDGNFQISDVQTTTRRTNRPSERRKLELTSVKTQIQKGNQSPKQTTGFNCLEKEMYRFYGDIRDCRLFHYCSPGFTARQVLDFRFVCEEGTIFDEDSQSCLHDVPNPKCVKRTY